MFLIRFYRDQKDIVFDSLSLVFIRIIGIFCAFFSQVLLARFLSVGEYGTYAYALHILSLLIIPAVLGLDKVTLRFASEYLALKKAKELRGVITSFSLFSFISSFFIAGMFYVLTCLGFFPAFAENQAFLFTMLLILPFWAFLKIQSSIMLALKKTALSFFFENLLKPLLFLLILSLGYFFFEEQLTAYGAIFINLFCVVFVAIFCYLSVRKFIPHDLLWIFLGLRGWFSDFKAYRSVAFTVLLVNIFQQMLISANILIIEDFKGIEATAIYSVALYYSGFVGYWIVILELNLAPRIVELYAKNALLDIKKIIVIWFRPALFFALSMWFIFFIFSGFFLELYGSGYLVGRTAMQILLIASLLHVLSGPVGMLLLMTGQQKWVLGVVFISMLVTFFLSALLIPRYGIEGASISVVVAKLFWVMGLVSVSVLKLGIDPTAFFLIRRKVT